LLPLRFPNLWSALAWLLTAAVIVGSLVPGQVVASIGVRDKVMHALAYFGLMVVFAGSYRRQLYLAIALVLAALGLSLDLLQGLTRTRSFEWNDVAANCAGVALGLVLSWLFVGGWCQRLEQRLLS